MSRIQELMQQNSDTIYKACGYEVRSEYICISLGFWHTVTAVLAAVTASGSAVSGWALWDQSYWKVFWAIISGSAALISILHGVLYIPAKVKEEEQRRQQFSALRLNFEKLERKLKRGLTGSWTLARAEKTYDRLIVKLDNRIAKNPPSLRYRSRAFKRRVQYEVNARLGGPTNVPKTIQHAQSKIGP